VTLVTAANRFAAHFTASSASSCPKGQALTMRKMIVLGCVLVAVAITLKVKLDTPQGPQPLARAILTAQLQKLRSDGALP
jgi:hypothetical protein